MPRRKPPQLSVETFADHQVITQPNPLRKLVRPIDDKDIDDPVARAEQALAGLAGEFKDWMQAECERLGAAHDAILRAVLARPHRRAPRRSRRDP